MTENIRGLSKQISSHTHKKKNLKKWWPLWKMLVPLKKQQKHILTINIFYFEILLQYSISCRSWNSAVFHPGSSVVWTSSSQGITLNAPESSVRREILHWARWDVRRDFAYGRSGLWKQGSCSGWWALSRGNSEFMIWKDHNWPVKFLKYPLLFHRIGWYNLKPELLCWNSRRLRDHAAFGTLGLNVRVHLKKHHSLPSTSLAVCILKHS